MVEYGCSRMKVSKVSSGIAAQGLITRRQRAGSIEAAPSANQAGLEILRRSIEPIATALRVGMSSEMKMLCLNTLHLVEGQPGASEERIINLVAVPEAYREVQRGSSRDMAAEPGALDWRSTRDPSGECRRKASSTAARRDGRGLSRA
jgi:DNA-binding GntR family transcriptional regulator